MKGTAKNLTTIAILAAVVCVLSPFSVPVGPVPLSFGSLAVYIAACLIDKRSGTLAVVVFVLLGAFGLPVFTGFSGGFHKLLGPTGGFILGYVPCALIIGMIVDAFERRLWVYPIAIIAGTVVLYAFGAAWFMISMKVDLGVALMTCVVPFLIGDALKIAAASLLCYKLRFALKRARQKQL